MELNIFLKINDYINDTKFMDINSNYDWQSYLKSLLNNMDGNQKKIYNCLYKYFKKNKVNKPKDESLLLYYMKQMYIICDEKKSINFIKKGFKYKNGKKILYNEQLKQYEQEIIKMMEYNKEKNILKLGFISLNELICYLLSSSLMLNENLDMSLYKKIPVSIEEKYEFFKMFKINNIKKLSTIPKKISFYNLYYSKKLDLANLFKNPYDFVGIKENIISYSEAKKIEYNMELNKKHKNKPLKFLEDLMYARNSYSFNKNTQSFYNIKQNNINILSHFILLTKFIVLFFYEFPEYTKKENYSGLLEIFRLIDSEIYYYEDGEQFDTLPCQNCDEYNIKCRHNDDELRPLVVFLNYISKYKLKEFVKFHPRNENKITPDNVFNICKRNGNNILRDLDEQEILKRIISLKIVFKCIYEIEINIKNAFLEIAHRPIKKKILSGKDISKLTLNDEQKECLYKICESRLVVLYGGPGTGKTKTISTFIQKAFDRFGVIYSLAPTASAAETLYNTINCNNNLRIINDKKNKLMKMTMDKFNLSHKYPCKTKEPMLIVIDELSMITYHHLRFFLEKIKNIHNIFIVLVGDQNQLPPIGLGDIARDINYIGLKEQIFCSLKTNYRADNNQSLINIIETVKNEQLVKDWMFDNKKTFLHNIEKSDFDKETIKIIEKYIIKNNIIDDNTRIITQTTQFTDILNKEIQKMNNSPYLKPYNFINKNFKKDDLIICTSNEKLYIKKKEREKYKKMGYITEIINGVEYKIKGKDEDDSNIISLIDVNTTVEKKIEYRFLVKHFELSYAFTCHKSQGKSIDNVIFILHHGWMLTDPYNNGKKNLYTGVSRARKTLIVIKDVMIDINKVYKSNYQKETLFYSLNK